ncbi:MAG: TRAP transporter large permease [Verrucomicrobiales bacterium]|nr:TRAP transporter large permease [Verrucomicrobiales bacterium]MDA7643885.1 TRAP transporter large permease [Verrucomicrobiales bacterium]MDF1784908.1 TRAP transporter large permease [Verrucomicrobiales bacterium]
MTVLLISLLLFLVLGAPVAYALGLSTFSYFLLVQPDIMHVLPQRLFSGMESYALIALPLFILMGQVMNEGGITKRLIQFCLMFVGRFRGGLGLVNVGSSMLFGGISGSSTSDTASIGSVLIPEMEKRGYPKDFAAGLTVASSTMGMIIPPSIPMILFAVTAQVSVGRLFLGGVIPGLLVGVFQLALTLWIAHRLGFPKEKAAFAWDQVVRSLYILIMPLFVVGTVVFGIATATESAGLGVLYAILVGFLLTKHLTWRQFINVVRSSILTSAKIMMIIAFSQLFIWVLALERLPETIATLVEGANLSPFFMLLLIIAIILAAGTFIDVSPAILLLTPVFLPAIVSAGISPILFGVILCTGLAVGACTPPVGNCLNVCVIVSGLRIGQIFRAAFPFLLANVLTLVLMALFPQLVLWLPELVMGES